MSRASNLAGFITAISPTTNLNVGVLTATTFNLGGTIVFDNISADDNLSIGGTVAGVTTITGTGINQPLGINTLGQTEFKGAVEFNDNVSSLTVASVTTINSDGIQSTGIGTFNTVAIGTAIPFYQGSDTVLTVGIGTVVLDSSQNDSDSDSLLILGRPNGSGPTRNLQFAADNGQNPAIEVRRLPQDSARAGIAFTSEASYARKSITFNTTEGGSWSAPCIERVRIGYTGNIGISSAIPKVSIDISEKTDAVALPVGTTAQRPSTAYGGYIRWNSTSSALEVYNGTNWVEIISDYFPSGSTTLG